MDTQTANMKTVYTVVSSGKGKSYWTKVGVGYLNQDGSWNLKLDAIPTNGTLQVREFEPFERRRDGDAANAPANTPRAREIA